MPTVANVAIASTNVASNTISVGVLDAEFQPGKRGSAFRTPTGASASDSLNAPILTKK